MPTRQMSINDALIISGVRDVFAAFILVKYVVTVQKRLVLYDFASKLATKPF